MMMTGNAMVCGVIGNPVGHSLSPLMHNYIAKAMGLDYIYVPCPVDPDAVGDAVRGACALGFAGLNVTVPYKQQVIPFLAETDESVESIGACNTLVRLADGEKCCENGRADAAAGDGKRCCGFRGYNTDAEGLFRAMRRQHMEIGGSDCLLIGAGGAARAAAYLLVREGASSVTVMNRSLSRAEALADHMRAMAAERGRKISIEALAADQWRQLRGSSYLAVQTTSVGMYPDVGHAPVEDAAFYRKISQAFDIVYTPSRTRFMECVEAAGGRAAGGLDMLIYQGAAALELWNPSVKVPEDVLEQVRVLLKEELHG